jgi:TonB family protein
VRSREFRISLVFLYFLEILTVPTLADPPFINPVFPPPGYVGPQEDEDNPHAPVVVPQHAIVCQENGDVKVALTIGPDGRVPDAFIAQSTGFADLDAAALIQVRQWRYMPATKDGDPTTVRITVTLRLMSSEKPLPNFANRAADCTPAGDQAAADALWSASGLKH